MKNNLVIYTPRTGSTVLTEILSVSGNCTNYNEGIVDCCEGVDVDLFKEPLHKLIARYVILNERHDFKPYHSEKQKRIDYLKRSNGWSIKETSTPFLTNNDFVKYCCNSENVNVYMVYRRDLTAQLISFFNMVGRNKAIYTNNSDSTPERKIDDKIIYNKTNTLIQCLVYWRLLYELYKDKVTLVCYEDVIKPMDFTSLGIEKTVVERYNMMDNHMIPTPYNDFDQSNPKWLSVVDTIKSVEWITNTL